MALVSADGKLSPQDGVDLGAHLLRERAGSFSSRPSQRPEPLELLDALPVTAREAVAFVRVHGPGAHLVGGVVRDWLLGRATHDLDLVIPRDALRLARALADHLDASFYPVDSDRDVGRVVVRRECETLVIDIAAYRGDTLEADLLGRDFSVNALAVPVDRLAAGAVVDVADGVRDLAQRLVRAVSEQAFEDDPARLIRAVRLAGELSFRIAARTKEQIRRQAGRLALVSGERAHDELCRILALPEAAPSLRLMDSLRLLSVLLPELDPLRGLSQPPPHAYDVFEHSFKSAEALDRLIELTGRRFAGGRALEGWACPLSGLREVAPPLSAYLGETLAAGETRLALTRVAALLHDIGKQGTRSEVGGGARFPDHPELGARMTGQALSRLRFSRAGVEAVCTVVRRHMWLLPLARAPAISRRAVYRYFRAMGEDGPAGVLVFLADWLATSEEPYAGWGSAADVSVRLLRAYFLEQEVVAPPPVVSGGELMAELGVKEGPAVGRLLEAVREAQAAGRVASREDALALARRLLAGAGGRNAD